MGGVIGQWGDRVRPSGFTVITMAYKAFLTRTPKTLTMIEEKYTLGLIQMRNI